jgi:hypothetical protein
LAVLAVLDVGRETVDLLFLATRLHINELHLSLKPPTLLLQIFVLKLFFLKLQAVSSVLTAERGSIAARMRGRGEAEKEAYETGIGTGQSRKDGGDMAKDVRTDLNETVVQYF